MRAPGEMTGVVCMVFVLFLAVDLTPAMQDPPRSFQSRTDEFVRGLNNSHEAKGNGHPLRKPDTIPVSFSTLPLRTPRNQSIPLTAAKRSYRKAYG